MQSMMLRTEHHDAYLIIELVVMDSRDLSRQICVGYAKQSLADLKKLNAKSLKLNLVGGSPFNDSELKIQTKEDV